jgi:hypothetical protein
MIDTFSKRPIKVAKTTSGNIALDKAWLKLCIEQKKELDYL